jgi:hypothetical protein
MACKNSSGSLWDTLEFIVEAEIAIKQGKFLEDERNVKLLIVLWKAIGREKR